MRRFDVHAHAVASGTDEASRRQAQQLIAREGFNGSVPGAGWTPRDALEFMDSHGTALQLLSFPAALGVDTAQAWNDQTAALVERHPTRFGLLAALPLADPDAAAAEVARADDQLDADGLAVVSNYDGAYLGDARFEPVWAEATRRALPVFVHPALPPGFERTGLDRPGPLLEYPVDTARSIVDALFAGVLTRHRDLRLVLAHAGGVLTSLVERLALLGPQAWVANPLGVSAEQLRAQVAQLFLDTAITGGVGGIRHAADLVGVDHLVYGTDYPPAGVDAVETTTAGIEATLDAEEQARVEATFTRLFPRAAQRAATTG